MKESKTKQTPTTVKEMLKQFPPKKEYQDLGEDDYVTLEEFNDWEGETYCYHIKGKKNQEYINLLSSYFTYLEEDGMPVASTIRMMKKIFSKKFVDTLEESEVGDNNGYMALFNVIDQKLNVEKLKETIESDLDKIDEMGNMNDSRVYNKIIYKGQIKSEILK